MADFSITSKVSISQVFKQDKALGQELLKLDAAGDQDGQTSPMEVAQLPVDQLTRLEKACAAMNTQASSDELDAMAMSAYTSAMARLAKQNWFIKGEGARLDSDCMNEVFHSFSCLSSQQKLTVFKELVAERQRNVEAKSPRACFDLELIHQLQDKVDLLPPEFRF